MIFKVLIYKKNKNKKGFFPRKHYCLEIIFPSEEAFLFSPTEKAKKNDKKNKTKSLAKSLIFVILPL